MQSEDRDPAQEDAPGSKGSSDWAASGFEDFEPFEGEAEGEESQEESGQGTLGLDADEESLSDDAGVIDPFDDTFESSFDAETGSVDVSEEELDVAVPEYASFTWGDGDDAETGEPAGETAAAMPAEPPGDPDADDEPDFADVDPFEAAEVALEAVPSVPFDADDVEDDIELGEPAESDEEEDVLASVDTLTSETYLQTTTQEFVDLAEEIARASEAEHVPSAVAASMPGVETGLVGLEDVVAATGQDPTVIPARRGSDLSLRILTGVGLAVIFFVSLYSEIFIGLFIFLVLMAAATEYFTSLMRAGYRPVGLFGLLGTAGALLGTWQWGPRAIPVALIATLGVTLIFFAVSTGSRATKSNAALTLLGAAWIGGLGGFVFEMLDSPHYGWLIVATIVTVALMDVAQYFFGRRLGRVRLAPRVSPNKTVEGLVGGVIVAVIVGLVFGLLQDKVFFLDLESPIDLGAGLAIGLAVAFAAPFGDLAVSALKRSLGVKDMGTVLPGHGGLFDRIDAMLFAIPLTWIVFAWTNLLA